MVALTIKSDFKNVQASLAKLSRDIEGRVISAALNKVAAKAKTEMTRAITSEFNLKAAEVSSRLRIVRANRNVKNWRVILDPFASGNFAKRGSSLNLIRFVEKSVTLAEGRRRAKAGAKNKLYFQIKKAGGKKPVTGAFIGNQGRTVFVRTGTARLPIKALSTIDVPQMFNTKRINARVMARIKQEIPIEFNRAIKAALAGNIR